MFHLCSTCCILLRQARRQREPLCVFSMSVFLQACTPPPTHVDPFQSSLCEAVLRECRGESSINQDAEKEETNKTEETRALPAECPASRERDRNCYWKEVREGWGWRMPGVLQTSLPHQESNEEFSWKWGL